MMIFNSFTVANDYNFGAQVTERPSRFLCRQIKLLKAFVQLLRGNFFKRSCEFFLYLKPFYKKRKLLNLVLSLFMNMSVK